MKHTLRSDNIRTMESGFRVWLDDKLLDPKPSQKVCNHSPDGFNWGYHGSGPSQLALAIVLKLTGKAGDYQEFKRAVIANIPGGPFEIEFEYPLKKEKEV